jgi:prolyl-tRNA editing enzyme YbaK/EbsC (Cys-tRNA(Pro) deacylase)
MLSLCSAATLALWRIFDSEVVHGAGVNWFTGKELATRRPGLSTSGGARGANMAEELSRSTRRFQELLSSFGKDFDVVQLPSSTRTAVEAAAAVGCSVEQIAKSILFRTIEGKRPVMVIASGINRVNESRVAEIVGGPIEKADAAYVREKTGFVIGGVPPIGHTEPILTIVDEDLLKLTEIWAAAGTPNSVFKLTGARLLEMTGGTLTSIK